MYGDTYRALEKAKFPDLHKQPCAENMPEVHWLIDQPYIEAFYMLNGSRQINYGPGKIPLSEILACYEHFPIGAKEDFVHIIQSADNTYIEAYYDDPKNQIKPSK